MKVTKKTLLSSINSVQTGSFLIKDGEFEATFIVKSCDKDFAAKLIHYLNTPKIVNVHKKDFHA